MADLEKKVAELESKVTQLEAKVSAMENRDPVLEMQSVEKHFGGVHAIDNFSVKIERGQIHGLIGPNGAGKTTIFNNITGIYAPDAGKILFLGYDITGSSPHRVAQLGIGRTFQNIRLFSNLSVMDNVIIASGMDDAVKSTCRTRPCTSWRSWACRTRQTSAQAPCPTATSANWRSRAPWRWNRSSCFSTSLPPA